MVKSFDIVDLEARLKAKGLHAVEGVAVIVVNELFSWLSDSCAINENALVKSIGVPVLAMLHPMALGAADKIDGQVG